MADAAGVWGDDARWYPEIVAVGDAHRAWQAEFDRTGSSVRVLLREGVNAHRAATVEIGELHADLRLSPWKRQFRLALRAGRLTHLQGYAADLASAADAARLWLSGTRPGQIAAVWPFLGSVALAEARERGDHREAKWLWLYENHCADPITARLQAFVALAFHEPKLRVLYPYTSHWVLGFRRTLEWSSRPGLPFVDPAKIAARYVVRTPDGRVNEETDAADTLRLVLAETAQLTGRPEPIATTAAALANPDHPKLSYSVRIGTSGEPTNHEDCARIWSMSTHSILLGNGWLYL